MIALKNFQSRNVNSAFIILPLVFLFASFTSCAQSIPKRVLLALSKANHTLAIVDPVTLSILARVPVGEDPHEMVASADGKTAYVCIYGAGSLHEINVIDLLAQKPLTNIDTRPLFGPHDISFINGKVYFTAEGSKAIGRFDASTNKLDWCMGTGQDRTHMIFVSADEKNIYTTNVSSGTVSLFTDSLMQPPSFAPPGAGPRPQWIQTIIPVSRGSEGFDVSPNGKELWTASAEDGKLFVVDLQTKKLLLTLDAKLNGANRVKFSPNGKQVFISSLRNGELTVFDSQQRKEIKRIKLGKGAAGILMDAIGNRAFVACSADNYIAIIDLKSLEVTAKLDVGGVPDGLAWAVRP